MLLGVLLNHKHHVVYVQVVLSNQNNFALVHSKLVVIKCQSHLQNVIVL